MKIPRPKTLVAKGWLCVVAMVKIKSLVFNRKPLKLLSGFFISGFYDYRVNPLALLRATCDAHRQGGSNLFFRGRGFLYQPRQRSDECRLIKIA